MSAPLSAAGIARAWPEGLPRPCIEVLAHIDSTQAELRRRGAAAQHCLLLADSQSGGEGRRGRRWLSAPGAGLYFSLAAPLARPVPDWGGLSLALGMEAADVLRGLGATAVALKWPNDLVVDGAKLGGLLVESSAAGVVLVGLGLNLCLPAGAAQRLQREVTDLQALAPVGDRHALAASLAAALFAAVARFAAQGFAPWRTRWPDFDALDGKPLRIERDGAPPLFGLGAGVAADGALLLRQGESLLPLHSGEVSVRLA